MDSNNNHHGGEDGHRLLVEAVRSEAEKELEPPPQPPLHSSSSPPITRVESDEDGDDADTHEVELAGSEKPLEESGTSSGIDQNLGVNADQDSSLDEDHGQIPGCEACQIIGRICPPDCPLARHFGSGGTRGANLATVKSLLEGWTLTDCTRFYSMKLLRPMFVESAVRFITGDDTSNSEAHVLLHEALLSEAEKELEPSPKSAYSSSSACTDRNFVEELNEIWVETADIATLIPMTLTKIVSMLKTGNQASEDGPRQPELEENKESRTSFDEDHGNHESGDGLGPPDLHGTIRDDNERDDGHDDDAHEVELAGSERPLEESGTSSGIDQNLGVNADQDSRLVRRRGTKFPSALDMATAKYWSKLADAADGRADFSEFLNTFADALSTLELDDSEKP